ncbi:Binding-protein-dependent transport systems inner membrane component [Frankia canadensis]|uniref:Binding-protein-dependent transport systems inner membrane component n=1 Tax=Frankia canadensis TaxID=1836972 RepID=A0A2I2L0R0_9ACTN|nr:sugar ABC transporter permease [Frankia canadensis]SNQ51489.1 Binding-protein-dependent transport systems inner membrane component [Frankia canadensis]SOU58779.1 Binding-protein-dependent transport systems inner membrane component [Frankia canadensis]
MTVSTLEAGERGAAHAPPGARARARPWLYLSPLVVALLVWVYGPLVFTAVLSFMSWNLTDTHLSWLGTANYARLVDGRDFPRAARNTLVFAAVLLPFATVVPMSLAIALWKRPGRVSSVYRALLFLPVVLAPVAMAITWQFLLDPLSGLVNVITGRLGLGTHNWLGDPATALYAVGFITAAKVVALNVLLFGASLASLDRGLLEAAALDGATEWEITRHLVLPHLRRTIVLLGMLSLVVVWPWIFANVAVLTQGGPDGATDNVYYRLFTYAFTFFDAGTASAAAVFITTALAVVLGIGLLLTGRRRRDFA